MQSAGLVDLQVNGFGGVDFNAATLDAEALDHALEAMLATGVTSCLPTIITAGADDLAARFQALDRAVLTSRLGPVMVPGYHLEGPFLNPGEGYHGCHPAQVMTAPDVDLVQSLEQRLKLPILLITIAPELPGSEAFVRTMTAAGKIVAIGHSAADAPTIARAAAAGARLSTHLGNGLPRILPKLDNAIFAQLAEDRLYASFIADGIHLPQAALKVMLRAKGMERSILVTDAVSAAAAEPGLYPFADMTVEFAEDGSVRVPGSPSLAGSGLTLDQAVRNLVAWGLTSRADAIRMASANPASLMSLTLARHRRNLTGGTVEWSDALDVIGVRVGDIVRRYDRARHAADAPP
jgi:N-acetylglucosamine-6-phosphate deacetylase